MCLTIGPVKSSASDATMPRLTVPAICPVLDFRTPGSPSSRRRIEEARSKSTCPAKVTDAVLKATAASGQDAGHSIQVVIDEVPEGNWAAAGHTISLASIADSVGLLKTGDRFAWSKSYFAAKARTHAAAGYPADAGGLWADKAS